MFVNISNHPSKNWGEDQLRAAREISGRPEIIDVPFPAVSPEAETSDLLALAHKTLRQVGELLGQDIFAPDERNDELVLHIMGEQGLCYHLVTRAKRFGLFCVHSTTQRVSMENLDGTKTARFEFVKFRAY